MAHQAPGGQGMYLDALGVEMALKEKPGPVHVDGVRHQTHGAAAAGCCTSGRVCRAEAAVVRLAASMIRQASKAARRAPPPCSPAQARAPVRHGPGLGAGAAGPAAAGEEHISRGNPRRSRGSGHGAGAAGPRGRAHPGG